MKILLVLISLLSSSFAVADEEHSFWSNVDKFLGKIADGVSKKDAITGLRTIDSPFHNEKDYRKKGQKAHNLILNKAKKDGVKVFSKDASEYKRVKRIVEIKLNMKL